MHRVKAKVEAEKGKKQTIAGQKRVPMEEKSSISRPQHRRRSLQQKGGSGPTTLTPSPTAISPLTSTNSSLPILASNPTGSPTNSFTSVGVSGTPSFTPQSQTGSSPSSSDWIYPFGLGGQAIYTPFGNSPPLFPVTGLHQQQRQVKLPHEMTDVPKREDDGSGQFWQTLFSPPGNSLPPPQYSQGFPQPYDTIQGPGNISSGRATGEFRDPNDINPDMGEDSSMGVDFDDGLVDWGDFIAQCSQVWVTE